MKAPSRQRERRPEYVVCVALLVDLYQRVLVSLLILTTHTHSALELFKSMYAESFSLVEWEKRSEPASLEGTGSMVLDRVRCVLH